MTKNDSMRPSNGFSPWWLSYARRLFVPVALAFLAYSAYRASDSLAPLLATISIPQLLVACLFWGTAQWVGPVATAAFAKALGIPLNYRELSLISVLRLPAKYLPGGIWQSVARFAAYRQRDVRNADSLTILVFEHLVALGTSAALGAGILVCTGGGQGPLNDVSTSILAIGLVLAAMPTLWIVRNRPTRVRTLAWMMLVVIATVAFWILAAAAFCTYWLSLFGVSGGDLAKIASSYLLSWSAGFVAIFAPQGLGIFEWVASQLLPATHGMSVIVTAVAGFRFVTIAGELAAWIVGIAIARVSGACRAAP